MTDEVIGEDITRIDREIVLVVPAGIEILKTASEDLVPSGTDVTYTYEVTNTGEAPLADVTTGVIDDFCSPVEFVDGDTDEEVSSTSVSCSSSLARPPSPRTPPTPLR